LLKQTSALLGGLLQLVLHKFIHNQMILSYAAQSW